jgi:hypothetical protein
MSIFACVGFVLFGLVRPRGVVARTVLLLVVSATAVAVYYFVPGWMGLPVSVIAYAVGWLVAALVEYLAVCATAKQHLRNYEGRHRTDR